MLRYGNLHDPAPAGLAAGTRFASGPACLKHPRAMTGKRARKKPRHDFISHFAKFGYAAKGVTYLLLAWMVWRAADMGHRAGNTQRAMGAVDKGTLLSLAVLVAIALGLGGYALWKLYVAAFNPEDDKWTKRVGSVFIAAVNGGLSYQALLLAVTSARPHGGDQAAHWSAVVMRYPMGIWAVGIAGVCIAGYGIRQMYRGFVSKLDDQLRLHTIDHEPRKWAIIVSRIGLGARGFVFMLVGIFLVRAAWSADPSQARDFGDSIQELEKQPFGDTMLLLVAAGLLAYAAYEFIRALYREIPTE